MKSKYQQRTMQEMTRFNEYLREKEGEGREIENIEPDILHTYI